MTAPSWFEDEPEVPPRRRRRLLVIAAVAAVWVVLVAALVRGGAPHQTARMTHPVGADDGSDASTTEGSDRTADLDTSAAPTPQAAPTEPEATAPTAGGPGGAGDDGTTGSVHGPTGIDPFPTVGRDEAEALTLAVVRAWLSDGGPDLDIPGIDVDRRAYLEHVAVEGIAVPSHELAVARALLVLLVRDEDRYTDAVVRRVAVPLTLTPTTVHPGGPPWWLPDTPDLTPDPPVTAALEDPGTIEEVALALGAAGYRDVDVDSVAATRDGGTVIAEVRARTPADDEVAGPVWLQVTADGYALLGAAHRGPPPEGADPPAAPDETDR